MFAVRRGLSIMHFKSLVPVTRHMSASMPASGDIQLEIDRTSGKLSADIDRTSRWCCYWPVCTVGHTDIVNSETQSSCCWSPGIGGWLAILTDVASCRQYPRGCSRNYPHGAATFSMLRLDVLWATTFVILFPFSKGLQDLMYKKQRLSTDFDPIPSTKLEGEGETRLDDFTSSRSWWCPCIKVYCTCWNVYADFFFRKIWPLQMNAPPVRATAYVLHVWALGSGMHSVVLVE